MPTGTRSPPISRACGRSMSSCRRRPSRPAERSALGVQLGIVAEDTLLVEGDAAFRGDVALDAGPRRDAVVQSDEARTLLLEALHHARKSVAQPRDGLKQRQIGIAEASADEMAVTAGILGQHALEIIEILRRALLAKILGALLGCRPLLLVIERARDRVMGLMHLGDEIGDGELQLVGP